MLYRVAAAAAVKTGLLSQCGDDLPRPLLNTQPPGTDEVLPQRWCDGILSLVSALSCTLNAPEKVC